MEVVLISWLSCRALAGLARSQFENLSDAAINKEKGIYGSFSTTQSLVPWTRYGLLIVIAFLKLGPKKVVAT